MEAIILAGGLGTRLREVVPDLPKPLAPIRGRPFIEILLDQLCTNFRRVILALGYKSALIESHLGYRYKNLELVYSIESKPLGTGGAIRKALDHCKADHVFIFNGDTFLDLEINEVEQVWQAHKKPIIVVRKVADTSRYGRIETEQDHFIGFSDKSTSGPGLINAGCYVFPRTILQAFESDKPFSLESDFLASLTREHAFRTFLSKGQFIDIGVPHDYERAQNELVSLVK